MACPMLQVTFSCSTKSADAGHGLQPIYSTAQQAPVERPLLSVLFQQLHGKRTVVDVGLKALKPTTAGLLILHPNWATSHVSLLSRRRAQPA